MEENKDDWDGKINGITNVVNKSIAKMEKRLKVDIKEIKNNIEDMNFSEMKLKV